MNNTSSKNKQFLGYLNRHLTMALGIVAILFIILYIFKSTKTNHFIIAIVALSLFIIGLAIHKVHFAKLKPERNIMYRFFFIGIQLFIVLILILGAWGIYEIFEGGSCGQCSVFKAIGVGIIVIWSCVFLSYFIWAIYFYNINLGLTEEEWDTIKAAKENKRNGNYYSEDDLNMQPLQNPFKDETFGVPSGTVRGMIAFTLLFGALAMLLVSIGMSNELSSNTVFWDQYEFFKKAFLMMIAFYFGSRSLQYLKSPGPVKVGDNNSSSKANKQTETAATVKNQISDVLKPEAKDPMITPDENNAQNTETDQQTFSGNKRDPMA